MILRSLLQPAVVFSLHFVNSDSTENKKYKVASNQLNCIISNKIHFHKSQISIYIIAQNSFKE